MASSALPSSPTKARKCGPSYQSYATPLSRVRLRPKLTKHVGRHLRRTNLHPPIQLRCHQSRSANRRAPSRPPLRNGRHLRPTPPHKERQHPPPRTNHPLLLLDNRLKRRRDYQPGQWNRCCRRDRAPRARNGNHSRNPRQGPPRKRSRRPPRAALPRSRRAHHPPEPGTPEKHLGAVLEASGGRATRCQRRDCVLDADVAQARVISKYAWLVEAGDCDRCAAHL